MNTNDQTFGAIIARSYPVEDEITLAVEREANAAFASDEFAELESETFVGLIAELVIVHGVKIALPVPAQDQPDTLPARPGLLSQVIANLRSVFA